MLFLRAFNLHNYSYSVYLIKAHSLFLEPSGNRLSGNSIGNGEATQTSVKRILFWNRFSSFDAFNFGLGNEPFQRFHCPMSACETTEDKLLINSSNAILINMDVPLMHFELPQHRFSWQSWVYFSLEPPVYARNPNFSSLNNLFNLTLTYKSNSDVIRWYGNIYAGRRPQIGTNFAASKTRLAAWVVSRCKSSSRREDLVEQLQEFIQIDIYGRCGNLTCPRNTSCMQMIEKNYKFYLSFENAVCKDYVTEKFFNTLRWNIVPIVLGGAKYSNIAPKNAYIDVKDFSSAKELANYLLFLDQTPDAYNEYFSWKGKHRFIHKHSFCDLCALLNNKTANEKVLGDVEEFWNVDSECTNGGWWNKS